MPKRICPLKEASTRLKKAGKDWQREALNQASGWHYWFSLRPLPSHRERKFPIRVFVNATSVFHPSWFPVHVLKPNPERLQDPKLGIAMCVGIRSSGE